MKKGIIYQIKYQLTKKLIKFNFNDELYLKTKNEKELKEILVKIQNNKIININQIY